MNPTTNNNNNKPPYPTPAEIVALAKSLGYRESRPSISATIYLIETDPPLSTSLDGDRDDDDDDDDDDDYESSTIPVRIHIYYTTRSIMTYLDHPTKGLNRLWRSHAYNTLAELRVYLVNPRQHSNKGYRQADHAVRACIECGQLKKRDAFSASQWKRGPDLNRCLECVAGGKKTNAGNGEDQENNNPSSLTESILNRHNQTANGNKGSQQQHALMERRQFNCPVCPEQGRGTYLFFKRVPTMKPVVKCPQCKAATQGRCQRLYAIPKGSERGYGFYKCSVCTDHWGSTRAIPNVGQQCFTCQQQGVTSMVSPFRMEVYKKKKPHHINTNNRPGGAGSSSGFRPRRVPREPIAEDRVEEHGYSDADRNRNDRGGGNALVPGLGTERSFEYVQPSSSGSEASSTDASSWEITAGVERLRLETKVRSGKIPAGYQHACTACATGLCMRRRVPTSQVHDISDGNTVSTRASVMTNSSADKADYYDRDEDFTGFEDDWEAE